MKYLKYFLIVFFQFSSLPLLWAMNDESVYDKIKTKELKNYLELLEDPNARPTNTEMATRLDELVRLGANPNAATDKNLTRAIHVAASTDNQELIKLLLIHKIDINESDKNDGTPLIYAVINGHINSANLLLEAGADTEGVDLYDESTPLTWAAYHGQLDSISLLLKAGANIEARDDNRSTPLINAAIANKTEAMAMLLKAGANINAVDENGSSSFTEAGRCGNLEAIFQLLAFGCGINSFHFAAATCEVRKLGSRYFSEEEKLQDEPWLHASVRLKKALTQINDSAGEVRKIINETDKYGHTAFDIALVTRNVEVIPLLLSFGADPLGGLYNGAFMASKIPLWNLSTNGQPSLYEQILAVPLNRCLAVLQTFRHNLPQEIARNIVQLVLFK